MAPTSPALLGVVRFRQPGSGLVIGTYAFVVATWAVVALRPGADPPTWELALQAAGSALFVVAAVLQLRTQVWANGDGVHARDQLGRRRHLTWPEVDRFEVRGGRNILGARTVDGRWVRLMRFDDHARRAAHCADELETYRRARARALGDQEAQR